MATVEGLKKQICELLTNESADQDVDTLMNKTRIWKLDVGETYSEIERGSRDISNNTFVHGVILDPCLILDEAQIAETDILILEIKYAVTSKSEWMFIPKSRVVKKRSVKQLEDDRQKDDEMMQLPLSKIVESDSRKGLTGLQNLGNTCFMNSIIQCLANTEDIVKFFLLGLHEKHINIDNFLGTRGKLPIAFAELLHEIWNGNRHYVAPWDLKSIIARRAIQFQGFAQHDSQEILSFMLETLHEDLNSVTHKPYVEFKDSDGRPDKEVCQEYWEGLRKREQSIFIDLFYGQLKSRVQCTDCGKISISFDPFNML